MFLSHMISDWKIISKFLFSIIFALDIASFWKIWLILFEIAQCEFGFFFCSLSTFTIINLVLAFRFDVVDVTKQIFP